MKRKKILIIICIVAVLIIVLIAFLVMRNKKTVETEINKVVAIKGDISNTISSSGTVEPVKEYVITTSVTGEILTDNVEIGQEYKKGDLLYTIDSTNARNAITKAENALEKEKLSYEQSQDKLSNLVIKAPFSGRISKLYVSNGDKINSGAKILDLVDSSTLKVTLPFLSSDAKYINKGNKATVYIESNGEELMGVVEKISTGSYINSYGALVSDVEISFTNPGNLLNGVVVSAIVSGYACNNTAEATYENNTTITAETSGTISNLYYLEGDIVSKNSTILELKDASTTLNSKTATLSLRDAQVQLQEAQENLQECTITSPIDGVVTYKYYNGGEKITNNNSTNLAVVADMSKLIFTMSIDELDIKNIAVGQEVIVTADALENKTFYGKITNINIIGSSSSGVTTYPVTVEIDEYEGLLPGMNVSAEIISEEAKDVVKVPTSAVSRGDVVLVTEEFAKSLSVNKNYSEESVEVDSTDKSTQAKINKKDYQDGEIVDRPNTPKGYKYIKVTAGLSDSDYIEIAGGLEVGNEVYIVTTVTKASTASESSSSSAFGMGGMPMGSGSMPMGGFSGGGMGGGSMGGFSGGSGGSGRGGSGGFPGR